MKKTILLLALLLPLGLSAQWSVVPNVGAYISWQDTRDNNNDGVGPGVDAQLMFRYNLSGFYLSTGLGYQYLTSFNDVYYHYSPDYDYNHEPVLYPPNYDYEDDYSSYSNIRIPIVVGYHLNTRVAPVIELGMAVNFPLDLRSRNNSYYYNYSGRDTKDVVLSFQAAAGIRFAFTKGNALELKSTFTGSGNVAGGGYASSSWYGLGFNVAYEITL